MPFANELERDLHFAKHGHKLGATDPLEYERMADRFLFEAMGIHTRECVRPRRASRVRFDFGMHYEDVASIRPQFVRTFYLVELRLIRRRGGEAGYFRYECSRIDA